MLFFIFIAVFQAFDNFLSGLSGSESRVLSCLESGRALVEEDNREKTKIVVKLDEIQQLWDDLKELSHARQEVCSQFLVIYTVLVNAKEIFTLMFAM